MLADHGKQNFPDAAGDKRHDVDRKEIRRPMDEIRNGIVGIVSEQVNEPATPARNLIDAHGGHGGIGLVTGIEERHQHAGQRRDPDIGHHALQIDGVTHMRRARGHIGRTVQERVHHLVDGI